MPGEQLDRRVTRGAAYGCGSPGFERTTHMKLNLIDRILLGILLVVVIFCAFLMFAVALGVIPAGTAAGLVAAAGTGLRLRSGSFWLGQGILLLLALKIAFAGRRKEPDGSQKAVMQAGEHGTTAISMAALDEMIKRHCAEEPGVSDCFTALQSDEDGLSVGLRLSVRPETELSALAARTQASVKEFLEGVTGIPVKDVSVLIESAKGK